MYRFNVMPIKIPTRLFFVDIDKLTSKFIWKDKGTRIARIILKNNKVGELGLPDFKSCYKTMVIKMVQYWWKNRYTDQWSRTESLKIDHPQYSQLIFNKHTKAIQWRKDTLFNKWILKLDFHMQKQKSWPISHTLYKI